MFFNGIEKKRKIFWKGSKRPSTPTPRPSEWSLSLEIICMHFILSGPRTSLHIFEGGVEGRLEFFRKFTRFGSAVRPKVLITSTPLNVLTSNCRQLAGLVGTSCFRRC